MTQPNYTDPQQTPGQPQYGYTQPDPQATPAQYDYGQQSGYSGYQPPVEHPQSQTIFILGIVGIFVSIVPFIAWYLGSQAKKEIAAGAPYAFDGKLKTGYLLGKVFSIIQIVALVLIVIIYGGLIMFAMSQGIS